MKVHIKSGSLETDTDFNDLESHPDLILSIKKSFDVTLIVHEPTQNRKFEKHQRDQFSLVAFAFIQIFVTVYYIYGKWIAFNNFGSPLTAVSFAVGLVGPVLIGWCLVWYYVFGQGLSANLSQTISLHLASIESFWFLATTISLGLNILVVGFNGHCPGEGDFDRRTFESFGCNYGSEFQMSEDIMLSSMVVPLLLALVLKTVKWEVVCLSYLINIFCVLFTILYFDLTRSLPVFIVSIPLSLLVTYENQRQCLLSFLTAQSKQKRSEEREKDLRETHAAELRHIVSSMAQSLRTPLDSLTVGIDSILGAIPPIKAAQLQEASKPVDQLPQLQQPPPGIDEETPPGVEKAVAPEIVPLAPVATQLDELTHRVQCLKYTNSAALMVVNRCTDYAKASQGTKLTPALEAVNFAEAVSYPIRCVKSMEGGQQVVELNMLPAAADVAVNIITDKKWLMENILCLLSNAVKYSTNSTVSFTVNLLSPAEVAWLVQQRLSEAERSASVDLGMDNPPMIRFEVEDSGIGINSAVAPTLFVPYKQTKQLATGGAGMGLYALAMRVEALGGYYGWSKRKDTFEGSLFWFTIPYKSGDAVVPIHQRNSMLEALHGSTTLAYKTGRDGGVERNSKRIVLPDPVPQNLNILVVDESPAIVKMSVKMLTQMGHRVTAVKNGTEAIQTMDREFTNNTFTMEVGGGYYDVVLMDMNMSDDGGAIATRLIRKTESERDGGSASSMEQLVTAHSDNHRLKAVPNKSKETTVDYKSRGGQGSDEISMRNRKKYAPQPPAPHHCSAHQVIIGVSIVTDSETLETALAAGLDGCIAKPFTTFSFNEAYLIAVKKNAKK